MPLSRADFLQRMGPESPGEGSVAVTASATPFTVPIRALYVEGAGTVTFTGLDGSSDTWDVPDNFLIPVGMTAVTAATATGLHGIR